jgi:mRNA interferase MazF
MLRGEIRLVDFEPAQGTEADKRRPAVVVSNDAANLRAALLGRGVITVVPLIGNVERVFPFQALLPQERTGLRADLKAQAEQVRSVDLGQVGPIVGRADLALMTLVDGALRLHLGL